MVIWAGLLTGIIGNPVIALGAWMFPLFVLLMAVGYVPILRKLSNHPHRTA